MALFSPSESVYFTSFLSAVDLDSSISPDGSVDPSVADRVPHLQGRESLAKRTKDLMSLDVPVSSAHRTDPAVLRGPHPVHIPNLPPNNPSYWPSIPAAESGSSRLSASADHPPERLTASDSSFSTIFPAERNPSQAPHAHVPPLRNYDHPSGQSAGPVPGSGYTLPPIPVATFAGAKGHDGGAQTRLGPIPSSASAPSMQSSTSTKRPLPTSATDPGSSKRARSSPSSSAPAPASAPDADSQSGTGSGPARPRRGGPSQTQAHSRSTPAPSGGGTSTITSNGAINGGGANANGKGTLLSPSQKRANHIQSEQKRRANIRRGYESLCEVVPSLREAIKAEEERERAKTRERDLDGFEDVDGKGSSNSRTRGGDKGKKKKGRGEVEKPDGRAGPRSENVVLQKTIDYITGLIAERSALQQRLELARGMLPLGHPALPVDLGQLDASGVPLWEREWNGGMDLDLADFGGAPEDDGGSEDEG